MIIISETLVQIEFSICKDKKKVFFRKQRLSCLEQIFQVWIYVACACFICTFPPKQFFIFRFIFVFVFVFVCLIFNIRWNEKSLLIALVHVEGLAKLPWQQKRRKNIERLTRYKEKWKIKRKRGHNSIV
jgi:hypothetical protein